jgi:pilus assembly protein FimV
MLMDASVMVEYAISVAQSPISGAGLQNGKFQPLRLLHFRNSQLSDPEYMQRRPHRFLALRAGCLVLAAVLSSATLAAELGDVVVRSHIGQQLSADIELVMLAPEDLAGVQVRLAGPNVYQGANVRMNPVLSSLRMSVVKRDNRQFLHLTTFQPVDAELLHLFVELGTGARASVRSATLWLTPEPAPVLPPAPLPAPRPQLAAPAAASPSEAEGAAQDAQAAANRAAALRAARMRAAANAARSAAGDTVPQASAEVKPGPAAVPIKLGPEPRAAKSKTAAKGVCVPGQQDGEAQQCLALDQTNAELKTKLIDLESKVKQLQTALGAGAAPAASASASADASAPEVANKAGAVIPPSTPAKANGKKKREPGGLNATTMAIGGVLLLALLGGLLYYLIRRKKIKFSTAPLKVWQGWRKDKKAPEAEPAPAEAAIPEKE